MLRAFFRRTRHISLNIISFLFILSLVACGGGVTGDSKNYLIVNDQNIIHLDEVIVDTVVLDTDALVVVYAEDVANSGSKSDTVVGFKSLSAGSYNDTVIELDKLLPNANSKAIVSNATLDKKQSFGKLYDGQTLFIELRKDNGLLGELEPSIDSVITQSAVSSVSFNVKYRTTPYIEPYLDDNGEYIVSDVDGLSQRRAVEEIILRKIIVNANTWVVIHRTNEQGQPSEVIGETLVTIDQNSGHHSNVHIVVKSKIEQIIDGNNVTSSVEIEDGERLIIQLYEDSDDEILSFDSENDPLLVGMDTRRSFIVTIQ